MSECADFVLITIKLFIVSKLIFNLFIGKAEVFFGSKLWFVGKDGRDGLVKFFSHGILVKFIKTSLKYNAFFEIPR